MSTEPRVIPVGGELPPMEPANRPACRNGRSIGTADAPPKWVPKHRNRFGVLNGFVDCSMAGLSRAELATWLVLWRDTRDGTARTSHADIARRIGTTRRTVVGAIGKLRRRGLVTLVYRGGLNRGASVYHVHPLPSERNV